MRNLPWKKIALGAMGVAVLALVVFYFISGRTAKPSSQINPAFGEYISSYTAGVVSSNSSVRIIMTKDAVDSTLIGQETTVNLFRFSPSIKGKITWLDSKTVEFKPEKRLPSGQVYNVEFQLSKLFTVPDELRTFEYSFQVTPQNFEFTVENVKPYVKTELTRQKIEGILYTADFAENEAVEKILSANQENKALKISWTHTGEGKQHMFVVEDVTRREVVSTVKLAATGESIGVKNSTEQDVEIPALGDFRVMNAKVVQNPSQYVVLQFSDPLKEKQDLNGLISIEDAESISLDFEIHDNEIWVYPSERQAGTKTIFIEPGVRNINDARMKERSTAEVVFEQLKPAVRFLGKGSILPSTDGLVLPFEAVNLRAVDVNITKVFENNMLQFLQVNTVEGSSEMYRVGRNVLSKTIQLDNSGVTNLGKWNRYTLDLATLINTEPGAIYQVTIDYKMEYSTYICEEGGSESESESEETVIEDGDGEYEGDDEYGEYEGDGYYDDEGNYHGSNYWENRDNPCHPAYYSYTKQVVSKNVLASDLGMMAKQGTDGNTTIFITDLKTTQPLKGISVEMFDYQQQLLGTVTTDGDGKAVFNGKPFVAIAKNGVQRGYLRIIDGESLSLSTFDVSGEYVHQGLKGFMYGDRGVWRPGDSLYFSFILEDKNKVLPPAHPVVFELQNPQGVISSRLVKSASENGFYRFATATSPDAPTGNWMARIKVGGTDFNQEVKIETVKPNRLKINLDFGKERIEGQNIVGNLDVKWLHGAPGRNLESQFDVTLLSRYTSFPKYEEYEFEDPSRDFYSEKQSIWEGSTNAEGKAQFNATLTTSYRFPGFMTAVFQGKVFEEGGNFSIDRISVPFYPYQSYVGLKVPEGEQYTQMLYTDTTQKLDIVFLDIDGKPVPRKNVEINMYRLERYWWWDNGYSSIANYIERNTSTLIKSGKIEAPNGKASWSFKVASADWGTYYIRVCDPVSGHCTGKTVYIDQPGYYSRYSRQKKSGGATLLTFSSDKPKYNVGEKINITIPGSGEGRALVSIESGSKPLSSFWVETKKGENKISIDATAEMAPNVFVNISLLQPHAQTTNDLPIRLYGVIPIGVEDPATHLEPIISMPEELEPGKEVTIKVSEKSKRKMTFTLAMVDEGLLDLTKFKTPEPWSKFYAREALGVKTWDLYDIVMGAFGSRVERLLSIGGDGEGDGKEDDPRANRFKPVVKFFGPITVDAGDEEKIKFTMPQYIGSVRTMVVAGYEGAYGNAEKTTPVRKPLMVLATLPRVLGPEEKLRLPITLFTQNKNIKKVKIDIKASGPLTLPSGGSQTVEMSAAGDLTVDFDLAVKAEVGVGKIVVTASSGSFESTDEIEIEVRNPNPPVSEATEMIVEAGKTWDGAVTPIGMANTNSAVLEISTIPPINLGYRLEYLMEYPHGCIEQTTSSAFPQLYLDVVRELNDKEKARIKYNLTAAIERLKMFVTNDGGFGYWPGNSEADPWGSTYAGHFLVEAEAKGYYVPADMIKRWKKYQKTKAAQWRKNNNNYYYDDMIQSYRLYTLALSGAAELSAMNRLRETPGISIQSKWLLAAAYAKAGQPEAAKKIIENLTMTIKPYQEMGYSYGSDLRDKALILETLVLLNDRAKGMGLVKEISSSLSNQGYWMSTQTTSFCLKAIGMFANSSERGDLKYSYTYAGKTTDAVTEFPIAQIPLAIKGVQKNAIRFKNESKGTVFLRLIVRGTPARGQEEELANDLVTSVRYTDAKYNAIDPAKLEQGTEFKAFVTVKNPGLRGYYQNLALTQIFPSGWEINNVRLTDDEATEKTDRGNYQDIRDDRVYTYFHLGEGQSRTFMISLTASYTGTYYLPAVSCGAMYDHSIYGRTKGQQVEVVKPAGVQ